MALVLTRKKNEKILIGDDMILTVVCPVGVQVKLVFDAPKNTRIIRTELLSKNHHANGKSLNENDSIGKPC